jgi:hypothetical protein
LDTRKKWEFRIYSTIHKHRIEGDFAPWVGALVGDVKQPIILVTEIGWEEESVTRLSRVGFDNLIGHLDGGLNRGKATKEIDTIDRITAEEFSKEVEIEKARLSMYVKTLSIAQNMLKKLANL